MSSIRDGTQILCTFKDAESATATRTKLLEAGITSSLTQESGLFLASVAVDQYLGAVMILKGMNHDRRSATREDSEGSLQWALCC